MKRTLGIVLGLFLYNSATMAAGSACPTLNLKTLPSASCATSGSAFKTGPLSQMSYTSQTPCPRQVDMRKKLQRVFQGKKDYPGQETKRQDGIVACHYNLSPEWQKVLATNSPALQLTAPIQSTTQVNHLAQAVCPNITSADVSGISSAGIISVMESTRDPNAKFTFQSKPLTGAGIGANLKAFFSSHKNLPSLKGQMSVAQPFSHICEYQHNTGGSPVKLLLEGHQDIR
ncbi:MAG: hypothetical protein KF798_07340 [Candidatus Paracaedibacteraceae bacterium]|nr:hypothetical protein [Candidatus Paracaedibacteraceae bacterium]